MIARDWPVCGHERAISLLAGEVMDNSVRHAYLIAGPEHIGKTTIAHGFAGALVCETGPANGGSCGECDSCRRLSRGLHPDVLAFSLDTQRLEARERTAIDRLSVDTIREISAASAYRPYSARYRVIIVQDASSMTDIAQEALLKTLEEPPPMLVLMLIADRPESMLPTIMSRCELVNLQQVSNSTIASCLQAAGCAAEDAEILAELSGGLPGWALEAHTDPAKIGERRSSLERASNWAAQTPFRRVARAFELAGEFGKQREKVFAELDAAGRFWRSVMMEVAGHQAPGRQPAALTSGIRDLSSVQLGDSLRALVSVTECLNDLESNVRPRLALEAMVMQWPMISTIAE